MISILGALFIAVTGTCMVLRRDLLPWVLSAAVPFTATAGVAIAGESIVMYPLVAIAVVLVGFHAARLRGILTADFSAKPGLRPLVMFGVWALLVTAIGPVVFAGMKVLDPRQGIDVGVQSPADLAPALSNFAQLSYMFIGIGTVIALGSTRWISPWLPAAGFSVGTVASSARSLLPESLQTTLIDNSSNVVYTAGTFDGIERMRGVFSEPAALGAFSVSATVFFFVACTKADGRLRYLALGMGIWAAVNAVLSFSGGAVVSGLIILAIVGGRAAYMCALGRSSLSARAVIGSLAALPVVAIAGPQIYTYVTLLLGDKVDSSSYENRSAADAFSVDLAQRVYGIGVGLGSNRPSSFFAALLSCTGVLGLVLLAGAVTVIGWRALREQSFHPTVWALLAIVVSKVVSGPDISDPPMWFLLAVCASAAWSIEEKKSNVKYAPGELTSSSVRDLHPNSFPIRTDQGYRSGS